MSPAKVIAHYGPSRGGVRVILSDDEESVIVKWRHRGERRQRSWPNTPTNRTEAKAWAQGYADELAQGRSPSKADATPLTLVELWTCYVRAEWDHLRPNSRRLYTEHWRYWQAFVGPDFIANDVTLEMVDEFRREQLKRLSVNTVNETIRSVRRVYNWGDGRELIQRNRVARYRIKTAKDDRRESPPEYQGAEFVKLLGALDPTDGRQWRAFVALAICGAQGVRSHAALHLKWTDLLLSERSIVWRQAWDKQGREWSQPLRKLTVRALRHARDRAKADGYRGPWILYAGSSKSKRDTYSPQSLWGAIRSAEQRSGVQRLRGRAAHGLRRLLAGDIADATGNPVLAMQSIGDTDVRMASRYLKKRDRAVRDAFRQQDRIPRTVPEAPKDSGNQTTTAPEIGTVEGS